MKKKSAREKETELESGIAFISSLSLILVLFASFRGDEWNE